jgi:hypothetical protein
MALSAAAEQAVRDEAERRGVDPDEAVSHARALTEDGSGEESGAAKATGGKPTFERLLIGAFPFIKVRELRQNWLGLTERVEDDEMFCGDFAAKHGGAASAPATPEAE